MKLWKGKKLHAHINYLKRPFINIPSVNNGNEEHICATDVTKGYGLNTPDKIPFSCARII